MASVAVLALGLRVRAGVAAARAGRAPPRSPRPPPWRGTFGLRFATLGSSARASAARKGTPMTPSHSQATWEHGQGERTERGAGQTPLPNQQQGPSPGDPGTGGTWHEHLSREEITALLRLSDARGAFSVAINWGLIAAALGLVALWPNPLSVLLALFVIGGRQLGCAVLMHEASHRTLLRSRRLNDWVGSWLCAYPVWSDLHGYRPYHLRHHAKVWTAEDPDLALVYPFPITPASLRRKFWRDLSGQTGVRFAKAAWRRSAGRWREGDPEGRRVLLGFCISNGLLLLTLTALGAPWLYMLWAGAWLTTYPWATRIRSIAEHAMIPDPGDPLRNTRTTIARWWERLLLAPNRVNYHLEHHLLLMVPHYRLAGMHALLRERGLLDEAAVVRGYGAVLRRATSAAPEDGARAAAVAPGQVMPARVPPF